MPSSKRFSKAPPGEIRIIAGKWRGRKLPVPITPDLRPTPVRLRETLFNWLSPFTAGARCLDLFAGSGALGLEAASRGAHEVMLVERRSSLVRRLKTQVLKLQAEQQVKVIEADAFQFLNAPAQPFDIVFLDPPFEQNLLPECCRLLEGGNWIKDGGRVYIEMDKSIIQKSGELELPLSWRIHQRSDAGRVACRLISARLRHD